ncbi:hypothetical protein T11_1601 [Trichinella zimbabwensis]|uniref:Uncharacterized protein n=1 Tax=Trichinella zimbabwensis TaxID=268475 RepID=A0A0V1H299_9BILA|nr:hypothetical protein T11_1601 [Trichinella zimbabwensis]
MAASKLIVTSGTSKITGQFFPSAPGGFVSSLILNHACLLLLKRKTWQSKQSKDYLTFEHVE